VAGSLAADSVKLNHDVAIGGDVSYNDLVNAGTIAGSEVTPLALPVFSSPPPFVTGPSDGPDVTVGNDQSQTLAAGTYGDVTIGHGGTLELSGGVYNLRSLSADRDVVIRFAAPSEVRIAGRFGATHDAVIGPADGSGVTAAHIVFYVAGINGGDGALNSSPPAAMIGHGTQVEANFYVPYGTLKIDHHVTATGAFLGRDVDVNHDCQITLDSAFFNRPPVAVADSATVDEGGSVSVLDSGATSLLANDSDPDGDGLAVSPTPLSGPDHGSVVLHPDGTFTYTHDGGETTADSFVYEVCDDGVEPGPLCSSATVSITVNPVNDPPVADPQSLTVDPGAAVTITLTGSDAEGDTLTFSIVDGPFGGTLTDLTQVPPSSATVTYTAPSGGDPADAFTFEVDDGNGGSDTATVSIAITQANQPPDARADGATVPTGGTVTTLTSGAASVLANDSDPDGDNLTVTTTPVSGPSHAAAFSLAADGTFSYTHDGGASTSDSFVYEVCDDGTPVECSTATVFISIRPSTITVTVTKAGPGSAESTVVSSPAGIDCGAVCSASFDSTGNVFLGALAAEGYVFTGWSGDADCDDGVLSPDADKSCTANFDEAPPPPVGEVTVTVSKAGDGSGTVTSDPAGIDCGAVCTATFGAFGHVELMPTADEGSEFAGWSGDGDCLDGVLDTDADKNCTANFDLLPATTVTLTVVKQGSGSGAVSSNPSGIFCGDVCSATYLPGTSVFVFARPDDGSAFAGWGGDCSGSSFSTSVTLDVDKTCTAIFVAD
jgi:VCBS repeat-containing protein